MLSELQENIPHGVYYILTGFGLVLFILVYLLRTSDVFHRRKFQKSFSFLLLITILSIFLLFVTQHKHPEKPRIAILPFSNTTTDEDTNGFSWAVTDVIAEAPEFEQSTIYYYNPRNLREVIFPDSLQSFSYRQRIAKKLNLDIFLVGGIGRSKQSYFCEYRIESPDSGTVISERFNFDNIDKLWLLGLKIAKKFQNRIFNQNAIQTSNLPKFRTSSLILYYSAQKALFENDIKQAKSLINRAIEQDSTQAKFWLHLAETKLKEGTFRKKDGKTYKSAYDLAWRCLKTAHRLDSSLTRINEIKTQYFILTKNWASAEQELIELHRKNPNNPAIYLYFSQLHPSRFKLIGFKNEIELLKQALFLNPGYLPAALALADYYSDFLQDQKQAIATLKQILEINPNQIQVLMRLGQLYISENNSFEVMKIFKRILELEPDNSNAYYNLGIYYYNQKDLDNALSLFDRAIKIDNHLDAHLYAAYIYEKKLTTVSDSIRRNALLNKTIEHLRYRIRNKRGKDDLYAETARKHLYRIFHN